MRAAGFVLVGGRSSRMGQDKALLHRSSGLLAESAETDSTCTVLVDGDGVIQPLCAVYRSDCLPAIQSAIRERRLKLQDVVDELAPRMVAISQPVSNVNTPEEWAAWQEAEAR
jgi:molybdopterin-guanine dinucleotide biosynthesis protein A